MVCSSLGQFLHGRRISVTDDQYQASGPVLKTKEALYQSQWEAKLSGDEDEEERHFCMLLESLGAINVFEEWVMPIDVKIHFNRLTAGCPPFLLFPVQVRYRIFGPSSDEMSHTFCPILRSFWREWQCKLKKRTRRRRRWRVLYRGDLPRRHRQKQIRIKSELKIKKQTFVLYEEKERDKWLSPSFTSTVHLKVSYWIPFMVFPVMISFLAGKLQHMTARSVICTKRWRLR